MLQFEPVSGIGVVESFSIVYRSFVEGFGTEPYAIAWIALPEQAGLRLMSNIVSCNIEEITIGSDVTLCFEQRGDFGDIPQFTLTSNRSED